MTTATIDEMRDIILAAMEKLLTLRGCLPDDTSPDAAYCVGKATGLLARALKSLEAETAKGP